MTSLISKFVKDEKGATLIEYGMMLVLILAVCVLAVSLLGGTTISLFTSVGS